jgi:hypothetical protein
MVVPVWYDFRLVRVRGLWIASASDGLRRSCNYNAGSIKLLMVPRPEALPENVVRIDISRLVSMEGEGFTHADLGQVKHFARSSQEVCSCWGALCVPHCIQCAWCTVVGTFEWHVVRM